MPTDDFSDLTFEWDPAKAAANVRRHGITFEKAMGAFADTQSITVADPDHGDQETRFLLLGVPLHGRLIVVVHVERGENIRIISARRATRRERRQYEEAQG